MHGQIELNLVSEKSGEIDHKSEDISGSVNRIDSGAIFQPRLAQELSRNAFVVSILSFWKNLYIRIGPGYDPKS